MDSQGTIMTQQRKDSRWRTLLRCAVVHSKMERTWKMQRERGERTPFGALRCMYAIDKEPLVKTDLLPNKEFYPDPDGQHDNTDVRSSNQTFSLLTRSGPQRSLNFMHTVIWGSSTPGPETATDEEMALCIRIQEQH